MTDPTKGRVEVEGLANMLGAIKTARQEALQRQRLMGNEMVATETSTTTKPVDVLLVSIAPDALGDFETPFGTFLDQKRQAEDMIPNDFPSLSYTTLQFARFEDNFVGEDLDLNLEAAGTTPFDSRPIRRINRRDAARAVAEALVNPDLQGKKMEVWTDELKR